MHVLGAHPGSAALGKQHGQMTEIRGGPSWTPPTAGERRPTVVQDLDSTTGNISSATRKVEVMGSGGAWRRTNQNKRQREKSRKRNIAEQKQQNK